MKHLDEIIEMSEAEFGAMAKNGKFRSREEIDSVYKLMDIVKDAYCIMDMEEGDASYDGGSYEGSYADRSYRRDGASYARGRGRNAKRDSMGRYSRNDRSYRYSREGKDEYIEQLREMMDSAPDDHTRQSVQRMIQQLEQD